MMNAHTIRHTVDVLRHTPALDKWVSAGTDVCRAESQEPYSTSAAAREFGRSLVAHFIRLYGTIPRCRHLAPVCISRSARGCNAKGMLCSSEIFGD